MLSIFPSARRGPPFPPLAASPEAVTAPSSPFFPARRSSPLVTTLFSPKKGRPHKQARARGNGPHPVKQEVLPSRTSERAQLKQAIAQSLQSHPADTEPRFYVEDTGTSPAWASALAVLVQPQPDCDVIAIDTKAKMNTQASKSSRYTKRTFMRRSWTAARPRSHQTAFVHALRLLAAVAYPQVQRLFANETDASYVIPTVPLVKELTPPPTHDTFATNVLHPIIPILNQFISPKYQHLYEIALFSEVYHYDPVQKSKTFVDYGIMVVDKSDKEAHHEPSSAHLRKLSVLHPLVFNEVKRHDLSATRDWGNSVAATPTVLGQKDGNTYELLPQLLMYADRWECRRVYLTDYLDTIAFDLDPRQIRKPRSQIDLAFQPCYHNPSKATSLYGYGARISIAFDAVEALLELGMVDPELGYHDQPPFDPSKLRPFNPEQDFKHLE